MLKTLLKYELRSTARSFASCWLALLAAALLGGLAVRGRPELQDGWLFPTILILVYAGLLTANMVLLMAAAGLTELLGMFYFAVMAGHQVPKGKSIVAIVVLFLSLILHEKIVWLVNQLSARMGWSTVRMGFWPAVALITVECLIFAAVFFVPANYLLKHRLNLE